MGVIIYFKFKSLSILVKIFHKLTFLNQINKYYFSEYFDNCI